MAKRGRPKGSLNKKTLEKVANEEVQAVKEESLPSAVDDAADVMSGYNRYDNDEEDCEACAI